MTPRRTPAYATGPNLALAEAMRGKASGAGTHADRRTKRNRTRGAQVRREVREQAQLTKEHR